MKKACYLATLPVVLTAGVVCAQEADPAQVRVRYGLSVRQHEALPQPLTNGRVDEILKEMSKLVQVRDSDGDVACSIEFVRHGNVGTFNNDEIPFSVRSGADFKKIATAPGSIKVVGEIRWCGGIKPGRSIGCAHTTGSPRALSVVRPQQGQYLPNQEAILWAHEFAHTTGSPHRDVNRQIMRPVILTDLREINQAECDRILKTRFIVHAVPGVANTPVGAVTPPAHEGSPTAAAADASRQGPPATTTTQPAPAEAAAGNPLEPITEFVNKTYFEGVPFNQASRYTDEDVPELAAVLDDPAAQQAWGNAVATLGAIGTEAAKQELLDFLLENPSEQLSAAEYTAKSNVPVAFGWLVHQSGDKQVLELLIKATNWEWWAAEANIHWKTPIHKNRKALIDSLIPEAISGLTLTGTKEARIRLGQLHSQLDPEAPAVVLPSDQTASLAGLSPDARLAVTKVSPATREAVEQSDGKSFLEGQLSEFNKLKAKGIEAYYGQQ